MTADNTRGTLGATIEAAAVAYVIVLSAALSAHTCAMAIEAATGSDQITIEAGAGINDVAAVRARQ